MLTDDAIKVLEFLQSTQPNLQYKFFEVPFVQENVDGVDSADIFGILRLLAQQGLVRFVDRQEFTFELTEPGKKYRELQVKVEKKERKRKWHEIRVSLVEAVVSTILAFLLGLLLGGNSC